MSKSQSKIPRFSGNSLTYTQSNENNKARLSAGGAIPSTQLRKSLTAKSPVTPKSSTTASTTATAANTPAATAAVKSAQKSAAGARFSLTPAVAAAAAAAATTEEELEEEEEEEQPKPPKSAQKKKKHSIVPTPSSAAVDDSSDNDGDITLFHPSTAVSAVAATPAPSATSADSDDADANDVDNAGDDDDSSDLSSSTFLNELVNHETPELLRLLSELRLKLKELRKQTIRPMLKEMNNLPTEEGVREYTHTYAYSGTRANTVHRPDPTIPGSDHFFLLLLFPPLSLPPSRCPSSS